MSNALSVKQRFPILLMGFVSLLFGSYLGLYRLGFNLPLSPTQIALHGPLMVCGFLGTVICLERAVAIGRTWAYGGALASALGALFLMIGLNWLFGVTLILLASAILQVASIRILFQQREWFCFILMLGSFSWLLGCALWLKGLPLIQIIPWWVGFLVLTIAGERLELCRFLKPSKTNQISFIITICFFMMSMISSSLINIGSFQFLSLTLLMLALWFLSNDIVRQTIKQRGITRYIAVALASAYLWLLVGALIGLGTPILISGSSYDAFLHAIFVGFGFSMIFGHAPIIFPAMTKLKIPFNKHFYLPLFSLHLSLILRVAGDFSHIQSLRKFGGMLNLISIILFVLIMATAVIIGKHKEAHSHN
ncbi:MAG: hypothetical protein ACO29L_02375 [Candidatus Methylopumilus sp.]